jgi:hypothetical protein
MSTVVPIEKDVALKLIEMMKTFDTAIEAYKKATLAINDLYPEQAAALSDLISRELQDPALVAAMSAKYDAILDMMHIEKIDAESQKKFDQLIEQLLQEGPLN